MNTQTNFLVQDTYFFEILVASKKEITRRWLQSKPRTDSDWIDILTDIDSMERMTFSLILRGGKFLQY